MGYSLGVDLGTTYSAAAIGRAGTIEVATLGTTTPTMPSVVVVREDGEILTGEAADRRAISEPARAAREFKRRLGDPVPMILGGAPYGVEALMGYLLRDIVAMVSERAGEAPEIVTLTHPANYTDYKKGLLEEAARQAGLDVARIRLLTEPEAAAITYAGQQRIEPGEVVAVYDFGGGTFDAAVLRRTPDGFQLIGTPEGMERLGGIDLDEAVLAHVDQSVDGMLSQLGADPAATTGLARLRDECRQAKEALSSDTDTTIHVSLPGLQTDVRLTREELEGMIRPRLRETVDALARAVASAGIEMADVSRVLLVGGSSRIPLVGQLVRELTGRPVALDAHPKLAVATGAAMALEAQGHEPSPPAAVMATAPPSAAVTRAIPPSATTPPPSSPPAAQPPEGPAPEQSRPDEPAPLKARSRLPIVVGALVIAALVVGAFVYLQGSSKDEDSAGETAQDGTRASGSGPTGRGVNGIVTTLAGNGQDDGEGAPGPATSVSLGAVDDIAAAPDGTLYVVDRGSRLLAVADDEVTVAYEGNPSLGELAFSGVAVSDEGTVVFGSDKGIHQLDSDGTASLLVDRRAEGIGGGYSLDFGADDTLYAGVVDDDQVYEIDDGTPEPFGPATFDHISDVVVDGDGVVYVADDVGQVISAIDADENVELVAGGGSTPLATASDVAAEGTTATDLALDLPTALTLDDNGALYFVDGTQHLIARVDEDGGLQVVIADVGGVTDQDGAPANQTRALIPGDISFGDGSLFYLSSYTLRAIADVTAD